MWDLQGVCRVFHLAPPAFPVFSWEDFSECWLFRGSSVTAKGEPHFPFFAPGLSWWDLPGSWKRILFLCSVTPREPEFPPLLFPLAMSLLLHESCTHQSPVCIPGSTAGQGQPPHTWDFAFLSPQTVLLWHWELQLTEEKEKSHKIPWK